MKPDTTPAAATPTRPHRIGSMDQFRGYTVAGMFVVNFLGGYAAIHPVLKHNNNYFSYADSIMPSFMFACGFSYRLTVLRRLAQKGPAATYARFVGRSLGLVLVSVMLFGFGHEFKHWAQVSPQSVRHFLARLVKADLWEVLAIIGVAQLVIMPVIAASARVRLLTAAIFMCVHLAISYAFNFDFVSGRPNVLDPYFGTEGSTAWDGGVFGLLSWSSIMLAGTLAFDAVSLARSPVGAASRLLGWGLVLMGLGYGLSCLSMLYDGETTTPEQKDAAASPVRPPFDRLNGRPWKSLLAEPPFVQPPGPKVVESLGPTVRPNNYWMMNKRVVSLPFVLFSTGFACALYGVFVLVFDPHPWAVGIFRTFGQNALAAYVIHEMVEHTIHKLVPSDSPLTACLAGLAVFYAVTYLFVRYLEKQGVYIRL